MQPKKLAKGLKGRLMEARGSGFVMEVKGDLRGSRMAWVVKDGGNGYKLQVYNKLALSIL